MSREWKPGDVIEVPFFRGPIRGFVLDDGDAIRVDGEEWRADTLRKFDGIRRLVLVDPEDREQVERLTWALQQESTNEREIDAMQAALREFANPTPPKPEEPTGLGAVVEDAEGVRWIRTAEDPEDHYGKPWQSGPVHRHWQIVEAVRVLNEGVTA